MSCNSNYVTCPACGARDLDLCHYNSLMVLKPNFALFTLHCPHCGTNVSAMHCIPEELRDEVYFAAIETDSGMCQ